MSPHCLRSPPFTVQVGPHLDAQRKMARAVPRASTSTKAWEGTQEGDAGGRD